MYLGLLFNVTYIAIYMCPLKMKSDYKLRYKRNKNRYLDVGMFVRSLSSVKKLSG